MNAAGQAPRPAVLVALGSNLGDPVANVLAGFDRLAALSAAPVVRSSLWNSTPVDCPPGSPLFVNAAALLEAPPGVTPPAMLEAFKALEREFGRREKKVHNEARPIDLDLIAWGGERLELPGLVVPHPRAHLRRFVLAPLAEIAPHFVLPGQPATVASLLRGLVSDEQVRRIGPGSPR